MFLKILFCIRMLKNKALIAQERIKKRASRALKRAIWRCKNFPTMQCKAGLFYFATSGTISVNPVWIWSDVKLSVYTLDVAARVHVFHCNKSVCELVNIFPRNWADIKQYTTSRLHITYKNTARFDVCLRCDNTEGGKSWGAFVILMPHFGVLGNVHWCQLSKQWLKLIIMYV